VLDPAPDSALDAGGDLRAVLPVITVDEMPPRDPVSWRAPRSRWRFTCSPRAKALEDAVLGSLSAGTVCVNDAVSSMVVAGAAVRRGSATADGPLQPAGFGFETFSHHEAVMKRSFRFDAPMRYPPYTEKKAKLLKLVQ